ncbi:ATP-binding cassette domain-containing protein [Absiella sp. AM29-15]|uniref:ATP-binding cassette domain-containing protein n=1 Tax=Absiella sp. AM29-15 TaxID=2292278 RepID=UPI000E417B5A|nr:ATP-binding cassette domain-containing protein [Absiella sp. AM29-15]RGC47130.1 ATP-binding cassette domain-containing protein [Absiella sp. AM29-15]
MKIKVKKIKFNNIVILNPFEIIVKNNKLNILYGKSGSGKTTILHALILENEFLEECIWNGKSIALNDISKAKDELYQHISYASQDTELLEDLTIIDHIQMYKDLFSFQGDIEEYKTLLDVNNLLDKYPMQLSGGERKRVSILLAVMKASELIILDEPTASLDEHHTDRIIQLIDQLLKEDKTLLVTTHDEKLIQKADVLYHIKDRKIVLEKDTIEEEDVFEKEVVKKDIKQVQKYIKKTYEHHKRYKKLLTAFAVICISFCALSSQFNGFLKENMNYTLSKDFTNELIIYKPDKGTESLNYMFRGDGKGISEVETKKIKELNHVKQVSYRNDIDIFMDTNVASPERYENMDYTKDLTDQLDKKYCIKINYDKGKSVSLKRSEVGTLIFSSYLDNVDYKEDISIDYHQDGIYISPELAALIKKNDISLKNVELEFNLLIPQYTVDNNVIVNNDYYLTTPVCTQVPVTLKIAGILTESKMGLACCFSNVIYMKQSTMQSYVEKYREKAPKIIYEAIEEDEHGMELRRDFYSELTSDIKENGGYSRFYKDDYQPWEPSAYTVLVDDASNVSDVIQKISKMGYSIYYGNSDYHVISEGTKKLQTLIQWASIVCTALIVIVLALMKYHERDKEKQMNQFFTHLGFDENEVLQIKRRKYFDRAKSVFVETAIVMVCCIGIDLGMRMIGLGFHIKPFIVALGIVLLIEYLVPYVIEKRMIHDKTKEIIDR